MKTTAPPLDGLTISMILNPRPHQASDQLPPGAGIYAGTVDVLPGEFLEHTLDYAVSVIAGVLLNQQLARRAYISCDISPENCDYILVAVSKTEPAIARFISYIVGYGDVDLVNDLVMAETYETLTHAYAKTPPDKEFMDIPKRDDLVFEPWEEVVNVSNRHTAVQQPSDDHFKVPSLQFGDKAIH